MEEKFIKQLFIDKKDELPTVEFTFEMIEGSYALVRVDVKQ